MYHISVFEGCKNINEIYNQLSEITTDDLLILSDFNNDIHGIDGNHEVEDIDAAYYFLEPFFRAPWMLKTTINRDFIDLSPIELKRAINHLVNQSAIDHKSGDTIIELRDKINELFETLFSELLHLQIVHENMREKYRLAFVYRVELLALEALANSDLSEFVIVGEGRSYFHTMQSQKLINEIIMLKDEMEIKEEKLQSNFMNIASLMIALFSIIGFNVYSIHEVLSEESIVIMNLSILTSISVVFFLIDFIKSNNSRSWRLLPLVIIMIIALLVALCVLI